MNRESLPLIDAARTEFGLPHIVQITRLSGQIAF